MEQFYLLCAILGERSLPASLSSPRRPDRRPRIVGRRRGRSFRRRRRSCRRGRPRRGWGDSHHGGAAGHDSAHSWFIRILSVRTVVAGLTFFGLGGLAANASGANPFGSLAVAAVCGFAALYLVGWAMRTLMRLRSDGTVHIENVVGQPAVVYLTIPGHKSGKGKITVTVQNRTMEYEAETEHEPLPTGAWCRWSPSPDRETVEVVPAPEPARTSHA